MTRLIIGGSHDAEIVNVPTDLRHLEMVLKPERYVPDSGWRLEREHYRLFHVGSNGQVRGVYAPFLAKDEDVIQMLIDGYKKGGAM